MTEIKKEVIDWLHTQQGWLQEAAVRLLTNSVLSDTDINELTALLKTAEGQRTSSSRSFPGLDISSAPSDELRLTSIGNIQGIENLAPRKPLSFGEGNLIIVYGNNGSGKSGYTRILKNACGKAHAEELKPNVFEDPPERSCCTIGFSVNGEENSVEWDANSDPIDALKAVDVFDTTCGRIYLNGKMETSYIPGLLTLFEDLVDVSKKVKSNLEREQRKLIRKLPNLPVEYRNTNAGDLYLHLSQKRVRIKIGEFLSWTQVDEDALEDITERLKTVDHAKLATDKRKQIDQIILIRNRISGALNRVSPEACQEIMNMKVEVKEKRKIAVESADVIAESAKLKGIGSSSWRALWNAAKEYSTNEGYKNVEFPNVKEGARCVLCHQSLGTDAAQRLQTFNEYIVGIVEADASTAENIYQDAIRTLPTPPSKEDLCTSCRAAGLPEEPWLRELTEIWFSIQTVTGILRDATINDVLTDISTLDNSILIKLNEIEKSLEKEATQHVADAKKFDRDEANEELYELQTKKWLSEHSEDIHIEIQQLEKVEEFESWKQFTDTHGISRKAGKISEKVLTEAFVERFNVELKALGLKQVHVELIKTGTVRGRAGHRIQLKGLKIEGTQVSDILSEGENRVVVLAAFLADVTGNVENAPFIFDDPISSLDQDFEDKVVDRMIGLCIDRQVLIFTHRLSFLGLMSDKVDPYQICIRNEPWGAGEPGEVPIFGRRADKALKNLKNERLLQAKKVFNSDGHATYYPLGKSICSDIRILMERIVETELLADVVQRHRRAVNTMGKIGQLAKIKTSDCKFVDDIMSKYSIYEHSQPLESPADILEPDEILEDIDSILAWHNEFKKRELGEAST